MSTPILPTSPSNLTGSEYFDTNFLVVPPLQPVGTEPPPVVIVPPATSESTVALQPTVAELRVPTLPKLNRCHVWGVDFDCVTMPQAVSLIDAVVQSRANTYAITANLNYLMLCNMHPRLAAFTKRCPLVLCDGKPIEWRSKLEKHPLPERVAGSDLIYKLSELAHERNYGIYFLGGAEGIAASAAEKLKSLYPRMRVSGVHCPPFGKWNGAQRAEMTNRIIDASPDILLVAFGQPKGEYWIEENYRQLDVPMSIQVGASFDFVTGNAKRAPKLLQQTGAEWLYRTYMDPRRLIPRYSANLWYLLKAFRQDLLTRLK